MDSFWAKVPLTERIKIAESIKSPDLFARRFLRSDPWDLQRRIMQSVSKPKSRTNVKACHASGKTWTAAAMVLQFLARFQEAIVITTAPTDNQVRSILWPEIHSAISKSVYPFPKPLQTELRMAPKRYALGFTTTTYQKSEGVQFQGFHAEHILFVLDEAPGVDPLIWNAIEGARAGGDVRILGLGNPTISGGIFYDSFHKARDAWQTFTISAFDTPNLKNCSLHYKDPVTGDDVVHGSGKDIMEMTDEELEDNPRPYLTTKPWVKEKYIDWGPDNPLFEARVLGEFPRHNEFSLIPLAMVERCARIVPSSNDDEPIDAGVDVAGPGDAESVLIVRQGSRILLLKGYQEKDPRGAVLADLRPFKGKLRRACIDCIGIGYNFALHVRDEGYPVVMVNVQESVESSAKAAERFHQKKAEYFWHLRERFQAGEVTGLTDETAIAQLTAIRYSHDGRGRIVVESKEELRKRGVKSPDRAEALMLAFCPAKTPWSGLFDYYDGLRKGAEVPKELVVHG